MRPQSIKTLLPRASEVPDPRTQSKVRDLHMTCMHFRQCRNPDLTLTASLYRRTHIPKSHQCNPQLQNPVKHLRHTIGHDEDVCKLDFVMNNPSAVVQVVHGRGEAEADFLYPACLQSTASRGVTSPPAQDSSLSTISRIEAPEPKQYAMT